MMFLRRDEDWETLKQELYAELDLMAQQGSSFSFIVVEGNSDKRVYSRIFDYPTECIIVTPPADGGRKLIEKAFPVVETHRRRTLGIIDRDFDYAVSEKTYADGLIVTPTHDLETLILSTPAFERLLIACSDPADRSATEVQCGASIIAVILQAARQIGLLRLYDFLRRDPEQSGMNFKNIPFDEYVDSATFSLDLWGLIDWILLNTNDTSVQALPVPDIRSSIADLDRKFGNDWLVCQGHDLMNLIAYALQSRCGAQRSEIEYSERYLRYRLNDPSILPVEYLLQTQLYSAIEGWEARHSPYRVLLQT